MTRIRSSVGIVLGAVRRRPEVSSKPPDRPPPPIPSQDPMKSVRDQIAQKRQQVVTFLSKLASYEFKPPQAIAAKLQESDNTVAKATQPEQFAAALSALNAALAFVPVIDPFAKDRAAAMQGRSKVAALPYVQHPVVADSLAHLNKCIAEAETLFSSAAKPDAVAPAQRILQGVVASLVPEAEQFNKSLADADATIKNAEADLAKVAGYKFLNVTAVRDKIESARAAFNTSDSVEKAATAAAGLKGYDKELAEIIKGGKAQLDASQKYVAARKAYFDKLAEVSKLRGADSDPQLVKLIDGLKETASIAHANAEGAKTVSEYEVSARMLTAQESEFDKCRQRAAELKRKAEEDNKAIPLYQAAYGALREARAEIATLPGATAQLQQADALLLETRIETNGQPAAGYAEAVRKLQGAAERLLAAAREASKSFTTRELPPDVKKKLEEANAALERHRHELPVYRNESQKLAVAAAASDPNPDKALSRLTDLVTLLEKEITEAHNLRVTAQEKVKAAFGVIKELKAKAPPPAYEKLEELYTQRALPATTAKEFDVAIPLLEQIERDGNAFLKTFETESADWAKAQQRLNEIAAECQKWMEWPPLMGSARRIWEEIKAQIRTCEATFSYTAGIASVADFERQLQQIKDHAAEQNLQSDVNLKAYAEYCKLARQKVEEEKAKTEAALRVLEKKLENAKIKSVKATPAHKLCNDAYAAWLKALEHPTVKPGEDPKELLRLAFDAVLDGLSKAAQEATRTAGDKTLLEAATGEAKKADARAEVRGMFDETHQMLRDLEALGVDVSKERALLADTLNDDDITPELVRTIHTLHKAVKRSYDQEIAKLNERKKAVRKDLKLIKDGIKLCRDDDFKQYFNELAAQVEDAEAMLEGNDPSLVALAEKEIGKLARALLDTTKDKNNPDKKTFKDVVSAWKQMSRTLGRGDLIKKRMNATYTRLYAQLQETIAEAKTLSPSEALSKLAPLGEEIEKAAAAAEVQDELYTKFKVRRDAINDKLKQVKKHTSTWITDKTDAFVAKFETSMGAATETAKTEGRIHDAHKQLDVLEKQLDDLLAMEPASARIAVQELDAQAAQEQRMLRDMCRQWEQELAYFKNTVLPETENAMKKAGGADMSQLDDLKKGVERIAKPLEPFMNLISNWPHKKWGANPSPDMAKATAAFGQARQQLGNYLRTANRLAGNPEGTNIDFEGNVRAVTAEWAKRTGRLQAALDELARQIDAVPSEASGDDTLTEDAKKEIAASAPKLAKSLRELAGRIRADAFDKPVSILANKKATKEQKLTAREEALRTLRLIKADLVDNKLVDALFHTKPNPFRDVRAELGLVRAGLKKIEIEVLVGI